MSQEALVIAGVSRSVSQTKIAYSDFLKRSKQIASIQLQTNTIFVSIKKHI